MPFLNRIQFYRSIFWFLMIGSAISLVVVALFLPETLRAVVGNGSIPAPKWNRALIPIIGRTSLNSSSHRPPPARTPNPLKLFTAPDLVLNLFASSIIYSNFIAVTATLATLFDQNYPSLTETDIGLCYLSMGGGSMISTVVSGKALDWRYRVVKRKYYGSVDSNSGTGANEKERREEIETARDDEGFPIEKARLQLQFYFTTLFAAVVIAYGWVIQAKTSLAAPLVFQFISESIPLSFKPQHDPQTKNAYTYDVTVGFTLTLVMTSVQTLSIDLFPTQGSSVAAAYNLVRCLMGAGAVSIVTPITGAIGPGWTYTVFGLACVLAMPMLYVAMQCGPRWRRERAERARLERERQCGR